MGSRVLYYITHWETWHWFAKYILIGPTWLWYCLKARSLWFYTSSNPSLTFGGYIGDSKREAYSQLPPGTCPESIFISPAWTLTDIVRQLDAKGLTFPLAAKPSSGLMGFMFRRINSVDQLQQYHQYMTVDYIIQEWVLHPIEVSVFYYRYPNESKGIITGFIRKEWLEVTGDGSTRLWDLIVKHPRARFRLDEMRRKHAAHLDDVIPNGEKYCLSQALNLSRGGRLVSLEHEKDDQLLNVFDRLSHYHGQLYFGRYDIRCDSVEDLKAGKNFKVLEFNGCGGEPHHVYGNGNTLWKACAILLHHWRILDRISTYNHQHGHPRWPHRKAYPFFRNALRHIYTLKNLDKNFVFKEEDVLSTDSVSLSKTSGSWA